MSARIRVLVIDDSAFARNVIREVLERDPAIEVIGIARDGIDGLEKIAELKPDVITLDLLMPDLDGLGVLRALPRASPPKVIIVSVSGAQTEIALEALALGAVDIVNKPTPLPTDRLYDLSSELVEKVKAAAIARPRARATVDQSPRASFTMLPREGQRSSFRRDRHVDRGPAGARRSLQDLAAWIAGEFRHRSPYPVRLHRFARGALERAGWRAHRRSDRWHGDSRRRGSHRPRRDASDDSRIRRALLRERGF